MEIRTPDIHIANVALYQLSYSPAIGAASYLGDGFTCGMIMIYKVLGASGIKKGPDGPELI